MPDETNSNGRARRHALSGELGENRVQWAKGWISLLISRRTSRARNCTDSLFSNGIFPSSRVSSWNCGAGIAPDNAKIIR
jgi:hypothetical protein